MSLKNWLDNGWLKPHQTDQQEISNLLGIVERDLTDAMPEGLSADWKFGIAYNAALKLCTIMLFIEGYRPENALAHYRTIYGVEGNRQRQLERACHLLECLPYAAKHHGI